MTIKLPFRVLHGLEDAQYNFEWIEGHWGSGGGGSTGPITAARAYRNAAGPCATGWNKLAIDTVSFDVGGCFTAGLSRYTTPATGAYQVEAAIAVTTNVANQTIGAAIYKNGVIYSQVLQPCGPSGANFVVLASDLVQCNAGDYIEVWAYCSGGNPALITGSSTLNYLSVVKAGA